jgi:SAM-dependent methyltransferase
VRDDDAQRLLASSFGAAAAAYAEHRPGYARDAVRWVLGAAPGLRVLDLCAGTGKLTAALLAAGAEAIAVEPDPAMRAQMHRTLPSARVRAGTAESIPLPDACVDAVMAGNAMHWFDLSRAGPEIARVLTPGGVLAGLWNVVDDRVAWVAGLRRAAGPAAVGPRDTLSDWRAATAGLYLPRVGAACFGSPEQAEFPHGQHRTADSLTASLGTRAGMLVLPEPERRAGLGRIRAYLGSRPETAQGAFTLPLLTGVLRVRRRALSGDCD